MRKQKLLKAVAMITMVVTLFGATVGAFAVNSAPMENAKISALQDIQKKTDIAISKLNPYVKKDNDGTLKLVAPKSVITSIDNTTYNQLVSGLKNTNTLIKNGDLKVGNNIQLNPSQGFTSRLGASGNYVGSEFYWWGFYLYFNSTMCNKAKASYVALGAVLSVYSQAFLGKGLGKVLTTVVQGALWTAAWIFDYYNSAGRGVKIRFTFAPVPVFTGAWSQ